MGVGFTLHIWQKFNMANYKHGRTQAMLLNMVGDLACNGL